MRGSRQRSFCHGRKCQKPVGGPFAGLAKVPRASFTWTRAAPVSFRSSTAAERHWDAAYGTPLTFRSLDGDAVEVTTDSLDSPLSAPATKKFRH